jgi:hypothetical protein
VRVLVLVQRSRGVALVWCKMTQVPVLGIVPPRRDPLSVPSKKTAWPTLKCSVCDMGIDAPTDGLF